MPDRTPGDADPYRASVSDADPNVAAEAAHGYRTAPEASTEMPPGIPYIVGNEAAERFSFYGMKAVLMVFMTKYLLDAAGQKAPMSEDDAKAYLHYFVASAYFFPIVGALLADVLWGKYRTILALSLVYCLGHLALAIDDTRLGLSVGLGLIAVGSGGIKPCVSAHVGDQFGPSNQHLLTRVFSWFYFSINFGAAASAILTPILLDRFGPHVAFAVPGVLMLLATIVFWLGRYKFVHYPAGGKAMLRDLAQKETFLAAGRLCLIYMFLVFFWSLFDQTASAWVLQAEKMDRELFGVTLLASQMQGLNPVLIMVLIPIFSFVIYPAINFVFALTPLRKIGLGLFLTVPSFLIVGWIETRITAGGAPSILWQALAYLVLTAAEVMVSIVSLEFSYTQAPARLKSFIMSLYLLSIAAGNLFAGLVNKYNMRADGTRWLEGADYYWFFSIVMLAAALGFVVVAINYRGQTYIHEEA